MGQGVAACSWRAFRGQAYSRCQLLDRRMRDHPRASVKRARWLSIMLSVGDLHTATCTRRPEIRTTNLSMLLIGNRLGNLRLQNTRQVRLAGNRTNVAAESR